MTFNVGRVPVLNNSPAPRCSSSGNTSPRVQTAHMEEFCMCRYLTRLLPPPPRRTETLALRLWRTFVDMRRFSGMQSDVSLGAAAMTSSRSYEEVPVDTFVM